MTCALLAVAGFVALVCPAVTPSALGATLRYPGETSCTGSLQECIDAAAPGDRIEIAADQPIDEDLFLGKSLTLVPAPGAAPLIGGGPVTRTLSIAAGDLAGQAQDVGTLDVTLTGLTLNNIVIAIALLQGDGHHVEISECRLTHAVNNSAAVGVDVDVRTSSQVVLRRNVITTTGKPVRLFTALPDGEADITVLGNVISTSNPGLSSSGIAVDNRGAGVTHTNIFSNVVYNVSGCNCLSASGIDIVAAEAADATVNITNNTLDDAKAIQVRTPAFTSRLLVNVFNNIVNNASNDPVKFPSRSLNLVINNGFNDLVKKKGVPGDFGGYVQGPGTFNLDPRFVGGGNYQLRASSPLIDVGTAYPSGGLPDEDALGNVRLARLSADMGAYEYGSVRATHSTTTTTSSTVTSITGPSNTTTTTLPAACAPIPTFESVACRLTNLAANARTEIASGTMRDAVLDTLVVATLQSSQAQGQVAPGLSRANLRRAIRALVRFEARLRSRNLRHALTPEQRQALAAASQGIRTDLSVMRKSLS